MQLNRQMVPRRNPKILLSLLLAHTHTKREACATSIPILWVWVGLWAKKQSPHLALPPPWRTSGFPSLGTALMVHVAVYLRAERTEPRGCEAGSSGAEMPSRAFWQFQRMFSALGGVRGCAGRLQPQHSAHKTPCNSEGAPVRHPLFKACALGLHITWGVWMRYYTPRVPTKPWELAKIHSFSHPPPSEKQASL